LRARPQRAADTSTPGSSLWGVGLAGLILVGWSLSLPWLLLTPLPGGLPPSVWLTLAVAGRSFLQTGLFIVAHDAMHGSLLPQAPRWNDRIGALALILYGWLPWRRCCRNHLCHHRSPAGQGDPDHHGQSGSGPGAWYLRFLAAYLSLPQMGALLASWLLAHALIAPHTDQPLLRLLLLWTLPLLISSLQLFLFGTYLPHRRSRGRSDDRHRAASLAWPPALSLLACFHFGYHWEHHAQPRLPWYRLPERRRLMTVPGPAGSALALARGSR
jgi:beta-carotene ketolase (CrtW type)